MVDHEPSPHPDKRPLRREVRARLRALDPEARRRESAAIQARLFALEAFRRARGVHCFLSLAEEVETGPILERCRAEGKLVLVPYQLPEAGRLGVARWSPGMPLAAGPLGVREPVRPRGAADEAGAPADWEAIDLVIVPGLAFDREGGRLGHGKGYYDRFLAELAARRGWPERAEDAAGLRRVAPTLSVQLLPRVPCDAWDIRMDALVTADETLLTFPDNAR
jgi:5-formyltetrahydrofolate cyclo-ligase